MASNVKVVLNSEGVRELLRSEAMMKVCKDYANAALGRLGGGYEVTTHVGKNRVNAEVAAATFKARKDNRENNSILKSLRG